LPWHGEIASILLLGFVLGAARRWRALQALRSLIIVWVAYLTASVALWALLDAVGYIAWTDRTPKYRWVTMSVLLISVPALAMLGAARALGFTRTQLNLARGDMRARGLIPGGPNDASWTRLGLCSIAITVAGGSVWIVSVAGDTGDGPPLTWLPLAFVFAAVNAAQEELRFRLVPLTTLIGAVGDESAMWMTATVFGLAHWSGATPGGPLGALYNTLIGAWLAKSILETRGVAWAWIIHAAGNLALFVVLVLTAS
jgi:membrane protease YdiL (CAAX protease family)